MLKSLLQDRQKSSGSQIYSTGGENCSGGPSRSLYREILFLKSVTQGGSIDVGEPDLTVTVSSLSLFEGKVTIYGTKI